MKRYTVIVTLEVEKIQEVLAPDEESAKFTALANHQDFTQTDETYTDIEVTEEHGYEP